jgi:hypothetical protein
MLPLTLSSLQPNTTEGAVHSIALEAEEPVLSALSTNVTNGVLRIEAGEFDTARVIKLRVSLPVDGLLRVNHFGPGASVFVTPGFVGTEFGAIAAFAAGQLYIDGLQADVVTLDMAK